MIKSIEPLGKHDRASFSCGVAALDDWFHLRAGQDEKRNVARVFVAIDHRGAVVGFYSLSSFTITISDLPAQLAKRLPRYDAIPAALIGRLARDQNMRGEGLGDLLLADAVRRIIGASGSLAVFAIVVDATDDRAAAFYRGFGFRPFPSRPLRLFMPTSDAAEAISRARLR
ncbi:MAG: GNAT family N-acetyltransferase [Xanthobacteraceae bacterium]